MNTEERRALLAQLRALSPAERSVLEAALQTLAAEPPTLLTTTPDSANDRLWGAMSRAGLLTPVAPLEVPVPSKVYRIERDAGAAIRELLDEDARIETILAIVNDLREKIPPLLIERVHGAHGTPFDLAMMLAGIVESTLRRAIQPHLHDEFLREVARMAEGMREW
jgi:hypothetical protein